MTPLPPGGLWRERKAVLLVAGLLAFFAVMLFVAPLPTGTLSNWPEGWRCYFTGSAYGEICGKERAPSAAKDRAD